MLHLDSALESPGSAALEAGGSVATSPARQSADVTEGGSRCGDSNGSRRVTTSAASSGPQAKPVCRLVARDRAARVRDAYIALHEDFSVWTPSAAFRGTFHATALEEARRRLQSQDKLRVLEVGCGHGTWAEELYNHLDQADDRVDYLGIDFTEPRIDLGRHRFASHPSARFLVADAETFEPSTPFDMILVVEVISHVAPSRYRRWLKNWFAWLAPGGCAVVIDKDRYSRHALRLSWETLKRRWLPSAHTRAPYYFPPHYGDYVTTLTYPSFWRLRRLGCRVGFCSPREASEGFFRGLILRKPF